MYTALFCMAFAYSLLSANWIVAIANLGAVTAMYLARVADEEQMLVDQFGEEYRAYMRRTGRLLPKLLRSRVRSSQSLPPSSRSVR